MFHSDCLPFVVRRVPFVGILGALGLSLQRPCRAYGLAPHNSAIREHRDQRDKLYIVFKIKCYSVEIKG